jgi:hypothetical protein
MNSDNVADALNAFFGDLNNFAKYLAALASLSLLTMALLQAAKNLFPIRRHFHRRRMRDWLLRRAELACEKFGPDRITAALQLIGTNNDNAVAKIANESERQLIHIAADGDFYAFYNSEIEDLCSQFGGAVQTMVDYPSQAQGLLLVIVSSADKSDLDCILDNAETNKTPAEVPKEAEPSYAERLNYSLSDERQRRLDARNRVRVHAQRTVEAFKLSAGARWKLYLQVCSYLISALLTVIALAMTSQFNKHLGRLLIISTIAGFMAPVARDLLAAIEKLRK